MIQVFSKEWFALHQKRILWLSSTKFGRDLLQIEKKPILIEPNCVTYKNEDGTFTKDFRTHEKWAKLLKHRFKYLWEAMHWFDMKVANRLSPAMNLGFDTIDSFYATGGEGHIRYSDAVTWDTAHDAITGDQARYGSAMSPGSLIICGGYYFNSKYYIYRLFVPVDTSSLTGDEEIVNVILSLYRGGGTTGSSDAYRYLVAVQTTQPSPTQLTTSDFDLCGSVNNPEEGSDHLSYDSMVSNAYYSLNLNATGLSWINSDGYTYLGVRAGNDTEDIAPTETHSQSFYSSIETGESKDPKLVITYNPTPSAFTPKIILF